MTKEELVDDMKAFAKIEYEKAVTNREPYDAYGVRCALIFMSKYLRDTKKGL